MSQVHIIGGGLAGSEAAWQAASRGVRVVLHEMRPVRPTAVHKTDRLAELVCSNSFRGDKLDNAVGLLKEEMRRLGSLVMRAADARRVPAGAALAVDRDAFSQARHRGDRRASAHHRRPRRSAGAFPTPDGVAADHRHRAADVRGAVGGHRRVRRRASTSISTTRSARSSWPRRIDRSKVFRASRWDRSLRAPTAAERRA